MSRALVSSQVPRTPERFSRTLGERNACTRSSSVEIVPMADVPMHRGDVWVLRVSAAALVALVLMMLVGWVP